MSGRSLTAASLIWTFALIGSRLIGLVRETVLGRTLGLSPDADAYRAAFTVPDWFLHLLAGGSLSVVFIPIFSAHLSRGDDARAWRSFSIIANMLVLLTAITLPVLWWLMPTLAAWVAPGFGPGPLALLVSLSRIVLCASVFHLLGGLVQATLLSRDQHGIPALAPLVYTGSVIFCGWVSGTAEGFAWGVLIGAALGPFGLPLWAALRSGLRWHWVFDLRDPDLRLWAFRTLPVVLGQSIVSFDDALLNRFGSTLLPGTVALLGYAKQIMRVPMGVFGSAMAFASFPTLTRLCLEGKKAEAWQLVHQSVERVLVLAFGSQVVLTVAGPELGVLIYGAGIAPESLKTLGLAVGVFSLALGAWSAQVVLARGYYAQGKVWLPTWIGTGALVLAVPIYVGLAPLGTLGLALASSISMTLYVVVLAIVLRRMMAGQIGFVPFLLRALPATAVATGLGFALRLPLGEPAWTRVDALWRTGLLGGASGVAFVALCALFRVAALQPVLQPVLRRIRFPR